MSYLHCVTFGNVAGGKIEWRDAGSEDLVGEATHYPIGLTLKEVSKWWYKVRFWNVLFEPVASAYGYWSGSQGGGLASANLSALSVSGATTNTVATETDLKANCVQILPDSYTEFDTLDANDGSTPVPKNFASSSVQTYLTTFSVFEDSESEPKIYKWGDLYYPRITILVEVSLSAEGDGVGANAQSTKRIQYSSGGDGSGCTVDFDGTTFRLGKVVLDETDTYVNPDPGTYGNGSAETPIDDEASKITVEVGTYWPHDPGDGLPVFDETTGEQLRDPAKIVMRNGVLEYLP